jgi:hypothetical protein
MEKKRLTRANLAKRPQATVTEMAPARACWKNRDTFTLTLFSITLVNHPHLLKNVLIVVVVDFSLPRHAFTPTYHSIKLQELRPRKQLTTYTEAASNAGPG